MSLMASNEDGFLLLRPLSLLQMRIKMIDIALTTLLSLTAGEVRCNLGPLTAVYLSLRLEDFIFFGSPRALPFDERSLGMDRLPLALAVDCISIYKVGRDCIPIRS